MPDVDVFISESVEDVAVTIAPVTEDVQVDVTETVEQVTITATEQTQDVTIAATTPSQDVTVNTSTPSHDVLIKVFDGGTGKLYRGIAGEPIEPYRFVYQASNELLYLASNATLNAAQSLIGMTLETGTVLNEVHVLTMGIVHNPAWNWTLFTPVFLGFDGQPTQVINSDDVLWMQVGIAIATDMMLVNPQPPIVNETV